MISPHKNVKLDKGQRAFFCGDIHGDLAALEQAIKHSGFVEGKDCLFLLGDVIDRGPNSVELIEYATCTPGVYSVLGNHEQMFLEALVDPLVRQVYLSPQYGGGWIQNHSQSELEELTDLIASCMSIAITVETGSHRIGVIHAKSPDHWKDVENPNETNVSEWLWSRSQFESVAPHLTHGIDVVVHGHVADVLTAKGNHLYIDTLYRTGRLSMLHTKQIIDLVL